MLVLKPNIKTTKTVLSLEIKYVIIYSSETKLLKAATTNHVSILDTESGRTCE